MSRATNILFMLTYALSAVILTAIISQMGYLVNGTAGLTSLLIFALCTQAHAGINRIRERRLSKHKISELTSFANGLSRDLDTAEDCLRELSCRMEEDKTTLKSSRKQEVLLLEQLARKIATQKAAAAAPEIKLPETVPAPIVDAVIVEEDAQPSAQEGHQQNHQAPPVPHSGSEVAEPAVMKTEDALDAVIVETAEEPVTAEPVTDLTQEDLIEEVEAETEQPQKSFAQLLEEQSTPQNEAQNLATLEMPEEFNALLIAEQQVADTEHLRQEAADGGDGESITDLAKQTVESEPEREEGILQKEAVPHNYTQKTTRPLSVFDQIAKVTAHQQAMATQETSPVANAFMPTSLPREPMSLSTLPMHEQGPAAMEVAPEVVPEITPEITPEIIPETVPLSPDDMLLEMIRASLEEDRADLYLQPIVTLPQRRTRFYEGLTRLRGPQGQLIMPADYTRVAEPAGMMSTVDNLLLLRCVHVVRQLRERGDMTAVFCNMSAHSIMDSNFFDQFLAYMEQNTDLASQLIIELSQDTLLRLGEPEQKNLMNLSALGFRFSMDRVTSLKFDMPRLKAFGFCFIKVPAMLLLGRNDGHVNADIHPSDLRELLARYDIELIAEHIEDEGTVRHVQDFDVNCAQGYLFGHPRPVAANAAA
ncbi:MAG: EAL domain-containing protein [Parvibaculaceae bacterium]|nr:EAL domain-containing protein [Parvibaculaceae bacterium]